jgi:glycosyltransferase involved in cell wall biosynthesis
MDQEPVTGGCHYSFGCAGYELSCGNCPLLDRPSASDLSRRVFQRKQRYLAELPITFVAPTSWVDTRIRQSALFRQHRVERIALPIDTKVFCPLDKSAARDSLAIPRGRRVIFFGSSFLHEPRKGGAFLLEALRRSRSLLGQPSIVPTQAGQRGQTAAFDVGNVLLLVAGNNGEDLLRQLPYPVHNLGYLSDEGRLAMAYRAADVFVCPSIEDAGPMMIPEAMLCGTPVVAFDTGGAPDLVVTGQTGFLANLADAAHLAQGLVQVVSSPDRARMGELAAQSARRLHEPAHVALRYARLVAELSESRSRAIVESRTAA